MEDFLLNINDKEYIYGELVLTRDEVDAGETRTGEFEQNNPWRKERRVNLDCAFVHYLVKELRISEFYRTHFIEKWSAGIQKELYIVLQPTKYDLLDINWNDRVYTMVREKMRTGTRSFLAVDIRRGVFSPGRLLSQLRRHCGQNLNQPTQTGIEIGRCQRSGALSIVPQFKPDSEEEVQAGS
ncbi:hypothetical protein NQ317_004615 [Molorchus minor]|uniref:Uncharacterized protein n=1 Tax=Molorchus minor TaxID=1323400 RepID=A0ABQ9J535_9CUCU|nr:hypothetical protein NQ317_004615 [Molorchus minor]